ncbi:MAG: NAD(P)-dependent oxidoreductase [Cyanobacteria bacterium SZAS TMP-1]|nr:NAD(P)-dependent oxidoreductase [Cyanobacteria bacterium SZAS TMP-1]
MSRSPHETAIVTGAPGWLGTRLIEALVNGLDDPNLPDLSGKSNRPVRALCLADEDTSKLKALGSQVTVVPGDLTTGDGLFKLFENAQGATVFHAAGVIHPTRGRKQFYEVNVDGTANLLQAASKAGVRRFIYVSSNSPIGCNPKGGQFKLFDEKSPYNPYMHYGKSKKAAEDLVNQAGAQGEMEIVIIRPPWFYGPGQPPRQTLFFTMIKNGKAPIVGSGKNLRSMAYVDNICQGLMLCETTPKASGKTYWIADSEPYTMNQVVDTIEKLLETEFNIPVAHKRMRLPDIASEVAMVVDAGLQAAGLYHQKFHVLSEMNKNIACSIDTARRELGYNPQIALEEGMRRSIAYIIASGQKI